MSIPGALTSSNSQMWSTPAFIFNHLKTKYPYDIDLCASNTNKKLDNYLGLDKEINSLGVEWNKFGIFGFCNPPYGDRQYPVKSWVKKAYEEYDQQGFFSSLLLPTNKCDQSWFHKYCLNKSFIEFFEGRIQFVDPLTGEVPLLWSDTQQKFVKMGNSQGSVLITFNGHIGVDSISLKDII